MKIDCGSITPWHFDNPFLYSIEIEVINKNGVSDFKSANFGFKKVELIKDKLFLNGEEVRLPGIETMPYSNPRYGAAEPREFIDSVVRSLKESNIVLTRFHWQQDEYMFDLMDEYGILVQEEIPWWQQPVKFSPELMETAKKQLREMTEAHFNHPSIFAWAVCNEVVDADKGDIAELLDYTKQLDPTRLANVVCQTFNEIFKEDRSLMGHLPTWNEYMGTWNGDSREELPATLDKIHGALDNRPLLITELGLCEPQHAGGDRRRVDDMFYHLKEYYERPYIIGFIYFSLNDYRTQMGEEGRGKYKVRRHGITDIYLNPKPSYFVFKDLVSPIEISKVKKLNEDAITVGLTVKNIIPSYTVNNYTIRYLTKTGENKEVLIPTLKPGESVELELKSINDRYSFEIFRPTGFSVIKY